MKLKHSSRLLAVAVAGLLAGSSALRADSRDDRIEDSFKNSHVYKTQLKDSNVSIDAKDGVAVLKGTVENDDQRRLADDTARSIAGVDRVDNQIRVTNEPKESSDDWISLKVHSALLFHRNVSATDTHVQVRDGVVTLTGTAKSDAEKALAEEYAKDVKGVRSVNNNLRVVTQQEIDDERAAHKAARDANHDAALRNDAATRTADHVDRDHNLTDRTMGDRIDDASITAQLKSSLAVRKSTSAIHTDVTTHDGVVTISGQAKNGAEKDLVTKLAENIDGVRSVHNEMTVQDR
jgi:hyperosmotically inducible periplasmic protein